MTLRRKTPLPAKSAKKTEEDRARLTLRLRLLEERGPWCAGKCGRTWTDMHEVLSRARGGDPLDPHNILCLCRPCHHAVTVNPAKAEEYGFSRSATPEERSTTRRFGKGLT